MVVEQKQTEPIRLDFESVHKVVVRNDDTGDLWITTVKEAAQACRTQLDANDWAREFESFLGYIHAWAQKRPDIVVAAYVGTSSEGLTGVIVTKGEEDRLDFDDEVTRLDIELAERFPGIPADVLHTSQVAPEARIPYIALERSVQVYGNERRP